MVFLTNLHQYRNTFLNKSSNEHNLMQGLNAFCFKCLLTRVTILLPPSPSPIKTEGRNSGGCRSLHPSAIGTLRLYN